MMATSGQDVGAFVEDRNRAIAVVACSAVLLWIAALAVLFPTASRGALRVWLVSPTFNHCFLILPISLFLIWRRRERLGTLAPAPDWRAAAAILALAPAWVLASLAGILEAQQFVVITVLQVALFGTLGAVIYRRLAAPFLYLYFLVPSGTFLIPALQSFTARFAVIGLHLLGIPVFSNGAVIDIPAGSFAVAEACAGLRFLIAAVAFGVFFSVVTYRSSWRRAAFIALSMVVPVIANGLRALGLIAVAQWIGSPQAALADHIIYGWVFFSFVLLLLVAAGQLFADDEKGDARPALGRGHGIAPRRSLRVPTVAALCVLAAATGPLAAALLPAPPALPLPATAPSVGSPWQEVRANLDWRPLVAAPARVFSQSFAAGTRRVDRFVALYRNQRRSAPRANDRAADERAWTFDSARTGVLPSRGGPVPVHISTWIRGRNKRVVWSYYLIDGHATSNVLRAKWDALRGYLGGGRCLSAYVALSEERPEQAAPDTAIKSLVRATEDLRTYLCPPSRKAPR